MKILSTNIGERKEINWKGKIITTGIFKYPVTDPIFLDVEEVRNDTICNRKNHGGIDQAIYAYSYKHYQYWKELYPNLTWQMGMFGENLTIDDLDETKLHVGDTFSIGEAILEVSKARNPCMKLGVRFKDMTVVKQFWNTSMCGVYFKVLQTGFVKTNDTFTLIKQVSENPTIAEIYEKKRILKGM